LLLFNQAIADGNNDGVDIGVVHVEIQDSTFVDEEIAIAIIFYVKNFTDEAFFADVNMHFNKQESLPVVIDNDVYIEDEEYNNTFILPNDSVAFYKIIELEDEDIYSLINDIIIIWPDRESVNDTMPDNDYAYATLFSDEPIVAIEDDFLDSKVEIFNTSNTINIQAPNQLILQSNLIGLDGKLIEANQLKNNQHQIKTGNLLKGIYLVDVLLENRQRIHKKIFINF